MVIDLIGNFFLGVAAVSGAAVSPGAYGRWIQESGAGEWFVLAHLGFFFMLLGCFGWAAWGIWKRTTRPEPHLKLLMELADGDADGVRESEAKAGVRGEGEVSPWERSADWWKEDRS